MSRPEKLPSARERVGRNLKFLREERGMSQQSLSVNTGLSRGYLSRLENGVDTVSVDNLEKLAVALSVDIMELLKPES